MIGTGAVAFGVMVASPVVILMVHLMISMGWLEYRINPRWKPYRVSVSELAGLPPEVFKVLNIPLARDVPGVVVSKMRAATKVRELDSAWETAAAGGPANRALQQAKLALSSPAGKLLVEREVTKQVDSFIQEFTWKARRLQLRGEDPIKYLEENWTAPHDDLQEVSQA